MRSSLGRRPPAAGRRYGPTARHPAAAGGDLVRTGCEWPGMTRRTELNVPRMTLAEGLARVMARPERREVFERAWSLARAQLEAERGS